MGGAEALADAQGPQEPGEAQSAPGSGHSAGFSALLEADIQAACPAAALGRRGVCYTDLLVAGVLRTSLLGPQFLDKELRARRRTLWKGRTFQGLSSSSNIQEVLSMPWFQCFLLVIGGFMTYIFMTDVFKIGVVGLQRYNYYKFTALETRDGSTQPSSTGISTFGVDRRLHSALFLTPLPACRSGIQAMLIEEDGPSATYRVLCTSHDLGCGAVHDGWFFEPGGVPGEHPVRFKLEGADTLGGDWTLVGASGISRIASAMRLNAEQRFDFPEVVKETVSFRFRGTWHQVIYRAGWVTVGVGVLGNVVAAVTGRLHLTITIMVIWIAVAISLSLAASLWAFSLLGTVPPTELDGANWREAFNHARIFAQGMWLFFSIVYLDAFMDVALLVMGLIGILWDIIMHQVQEDIVGSPDNTGIWLPFACAMCSFWFVLLRILRILRRAQLVEADNKVYQKAWNLALQEPGFKDGLQILQQQVAAFRARTRGRCVIQIRRKGARVLDVLTAQGNGSFVCSSNPSQQTELLDDEDDVPGDDTAWKRRSLEHLDVEGDTPSMSSIFNKKSRVADSLEGLGTYMPEDNLDVLFVQATVLQSKLLSYVVDHARVSGGKFAMRMEGGEMGSVEHTFRGTFPSKLFRQDKQKALCSKWAPTEFVSWEQASSPSDLVLGQVKPIRRILEKCDLVYQGNPSRMLDLTRQRLVFNTPTGIAEFLQSISSDPHVVVMRVRSNMHAGVQEEGSEAEAERQARQPAQRENAYKFVSVNMRIVDEDTLRLGTDLHTCEILLELRQMAQVRTVAMHERYKIRRNLEQVVSVSFDWLGRKSANVNRDEAQRVAGDLLRSIDAPSRGNTMDTESGFHAWGQGSGLKPKALLPPPPPDHAAMGAASRKRGEVHSGPSAASLQGEPGTLDALPSPYRAEGPSGSGEDVLKNGSGSNGSGSNGSGSHGSGSNGYGSNGYGSNGSRSQTSPDGTQAGASVSIEEQLPDRPPAQEHVLTSWGLAIPWETFEALEHMTTLSTRGLRGHMDELLHRKVVGLQDASFMSILYTSKPLAHASTKVFWRVIFLIFSVGFLLVVPRTIPQIDRNNLLAPVPTYSSYRLRSIETREGLEPSSPSVSAFGLITEDGGHFLGRMPGCTGATSESMRSVCAGLNMSSREAFVDIAFEEAQVGASYTIFLSMPVTMRGWYLVTGEEGTRIEDDPARYEVLGANVSMSDSVFGDGAGSGDEGEEGEGEGEGWVRVGTPVWRAVYYFQSSAVMTDLPSSLPEERGVLVEYDFPMNTPFFIFKILRTISMTLGIFLYVVFGTLRWSTHATKPLLVGLAGMYVLVPISIAGYLDLGHWRHACEVGLGTAGYMCLGVLIFIDETRLRHWLPLCAAIDFIASLLLDVWVFGADQGVLGVSAVVGWCLLSWYAIINVLRTISHYKAKKLVEQDRGRYEALWETLKAKEGVIEGLQHLDRVISMIGLDERSPCKQLTRQTLDSAMRQNIPLPPGRRRSSMMRGTRAQVSFTALLPNQQSGLPVPQRTTNEKELLTHHYEFQQQSAVLGFLGQVLLPNMKNVRKPIASLDQLYAQAYITQGLLIEKSKQWAEQSHGIFSIKRTRGEKEKRVPPQYVKWEEAKGNVDVHNKILWTTIKRKKRALEKVMRSYGNDVSKLQDISRTALYYENVADLTLCLGQIAIDPDIYIERIKNRLSPRYDAKSSAGYRDLLINLRIITPLAVALGIELHVCEFQLVLKDFADLKHTNGHGNYISYRNSRAA